MKRIQAAGSNGLNGLGICGVSGNSAGTEAINYNISLNESGSYSYF